MAAIDTKIIILVNSSKIYKIYNLNFETHLSEKTLFSFTIKNAPFPVVSFQNLSSRKILVPPTKCLQNLQGWYFYK